MKQIILLLIISLPITGIAQKPGDVEMSFGGGLNQSSYSNDRESYDTQVGYNLNATAEVFITRQWGIKAGFYYDQKGVNNLVLVDENNFFYYLDIESDYYTIPLTATYHFGENYRWNFDFGIYTGFLANSNRQDLDPQGLNPDDVDRIVNGVRENDWGLALAIGYEFVVAKNGKIFIELNSQSGFIDVFDDDVLAFDYDIRNTRYALNVGYRLLLF